MKMAYLALALKGNQSELQDMVSDFFFDRN